MLKVVREGRSRLEDGSPCTVQHCLDETPPTRFRFGGSTPIPPEQRFTKDDAQRVFNALVPARFRQPAEA